MTISQLILIRSTMSFIENWQACLFVDENDIREMYEAAELRIKSLDLMEFTENDRAIRNSWRHVIATR